MRIRRISKIDVSKVPEMMMAMEAAAYLNNTAKAIERLHELVPDFRTPDTGEGMDVAKADWVEEEPVYSGSQQLGAIEASLTPDGLTDMAGRKVVGPAHK